MKGLTSILLLSISCTATAFSQTRSDRERDGLKGPVQTVRVRQTTTVNENGKQTESPLLLSHAITYDQQGNRTELVLYSDTGALSRRIMYTYDLKTKRNSGLVIFNSQNSIVRKVVDVYGNNGLKANSSTQDFNEAGTLLRRTELLFDEFGSLIEVSTYDGAGSLIRKERAPFTEPQRKDVSPPQVPQTDSVDRLISFGRGSSELGEPDLHGNWSQGFLPSTTRTYASGKRVKITNVVYREFTYFENQK